MQPVPKRYLKHGTLTQLRVFEAAARLGSFSRAAESLFISQPTVSVQIKKLTETVGAPLFDQVGKQIRLTDAGRRLYALCQEIFAKFTEFDQALDTLKEQQVSQLCLAASNLAERFASQLLRGFCAAHPEVEVALELLPCGQMHQRFLAGLDDLYIFRYPPQAEGLAYMAVAPNELMVCARRDHPLAVRQHIPLETIAREPLITREAESSLRMDIHSLFNAGQLEPQIRMAVGSDEMILDAVQDGLGIAIVHSNALEGFRTNDLVYLDVTGFPVKRYWYLAYSKKKTMSPIARRFIAYARREAIGPQPGALHHAA
jgi:LysR family transcriptional regulator, low CO2-responsive transcriptional regulator